jgi:hypothetical protein
MNTRVGRVVQIASSFTCKPIEHSLVAAIVRAGIGTGVGFSQYEQISEYMLGPASDSDQILGTIVLIRVEDWLRPDLKSVPPDAARVAPNQQLQQKLRVRVNEFVSQISSLARRGKPVWFLACPSRGWIAERHKIVTLCQTNTNLIVARLQNDSKIATLRWPTASFTGEVEDNHADRLGQIPFTEQTFEQLGEFLGARVARTLEGQDPNAVSAVQAKSSELGDFLAGLKVHVQLAPAESNDRTKLDHILRLTADFSLKGEKRDLSESELDAIMASGVCMRVVVSDRLSNYGISGTLAYRATSDALIVYSMALSCAVLGKQVEYAVLSALTEIASDLKVEKIVFEFNPTARNQPTRRFLDSVADRLSDTQFVVPLALSKERIQAAAVNAGAWTIEVGRGVAGSTAR